MEPAFQRTWSRNDGLNQVLAGDTGWILEQLPEGLTQKVPVPNYQINYDIDLECGNLDRDLELHIDPWAAGVNARKHADINEDINLNWKHRIGLYKGSPHWRTIYQGECMQMYVPVWTEQGVYQPPNQMEKESNADYNKRVERYNQDWFGWTQSTDPVRAVMFLDRDGDATLGVRDLEFPAIEIARKYGDYDRSKGSKEEQDALAFQICREQFPWMRAGEPSAKFDPQDSSAFRTKIKVRVVDDGVTITHHIEGTDEKFREVDSYKNPFGRCSLQILSGVYRAGYPLDERFGPLFKALSREYQNAMMSDSLIASYAAEAAVRRVATLGTGEAAARWIGMSQEEREAFDIEIDPKKLTMMVGSLDSFAGLGDQISLEKERRASIELALQRLRPLNLFNSPEGAQVVEYAKATVALMASEALGVRLQYPYDCNARFLNNTMEMLEHAWFFTANPHYKRDSYETNEKADVPFAAMMTGNEQAFGRVTRRGDLRSLTPAQIDFKKTRTVFARDDRLSTKAAMRAEADALRFTVSGEKRLDYDRWLAMSTGIANISELKTDLKADENYQYDAPAKFQAMSDGATQYISQQMGMDPLLFSIAHDIQVAPEGGSSMGGANASNGQQRMASPSQDSPVGSASGV